MVGGLRPPKSPGSWNALPITLLTGGSTPGPGCFGTQTQTFFLLLPLHSRDEVLKGVWNQTHLVVLNFCLERLHSLPYLKIKPAQTVGVSIIIIIMVLFYLFSRYYAISKEISIR